MSLFSNPTRRATSKRCSGESISWRLFLITVDLSAEIDKYNILEATKVAMKRAIDKVNNQIKIDYLLIDGNMKFDFDYQYKSIIKGDYYSISISAASVVAKVYRDRMLIELDKKYPMYGFKSHKGYPTKKHLEAIKKYGLIDGYRLTYGPIKEVLNVKF